jgi:shikimate kinase
MQPLRHFENVALIGFMGTGKTTVGYALAGLLQFQLVDTDELIERRARQRISEIFRTDGEARFRAYEHEVVSELAQGKRLVIATGGGLAASSENLVSLKTHSLVVCLWASVGAIWERVRHQTHRPLLDDPDPRARIQQLLAKREPFYRQADVLVNTELRSVREVALQVAYQFRLAREQTTR